MNTSHGSANAKPQCEPAGGKHPAEVAQRLLLSPVVLGIAGCSGSGKTTLAIELARELGGVHFPIDHYYRDLAHLPPVERTRQNFDDPELIDYTLLASHLAALAKGNAIERPVYDFTTHTRVAGCTEQIAACTFPIVEGLFALHYADLLPLYDLRIYVNAPDDLCFERRMKRDIEQRGRTAESVRQQYEATVRPTGIGLVQPSAARADLIVDGSQSPDRIVEQVVAELRRRRLVTAPVT